MTQVAPLFSFISGVGVTIGKEASRCHRRFVGICERSLTSKYTAQQRKGLSQTDRCFPRTQQRTVDQHDRQSLLLQCFSQLFQDRFQLLFCAAFGQTERHRRRAHGGLGEIHETVQADTESALDQLLFRYGKIG